MKRLILLVMIVASAAFCQKDEELVTVPKKYVSAEGLTAQRVEENGKMVSRASEYVGLGKEIGVAVHEGLSAVADDVNHFAGTPVGKFTLFMIAFKIIGDRVIHIVLGIPLYFIVMFMWFRATGYFFGLGKRVVVIRETTDGGKKIKEYGPAPTYKFQSGDGRATAGIFLGGFALLWTALMAFAIIL